MLHCQNGRPLTCQLAFKVLLKLEGPLFPSAVSEGSLIPTDSEGSGRVTAECTFLIFCFCELLKFELCSMPNLILMGKSFHLDDQEYFVFIAP